MTALACESAAPILVAAFASDIATTSRVDLRLRRFPASDAITVELYDDLETILGEDAARLSAEATWCALPRGAPWVIFGYSPTVPPLPVGTGRGRVERKPYVFIDFPSELEAALIDSSLPPWQLDGSFLAQSTMEEYRTALTAIPRFEETAAALRHALTGKGGGYAVLRLGNLVKVLGSGVRLRRLATGFAAEVAIPFSPFPRWPLWKDIGVKVKKDPGKSSGIGYNAFHMDSPERIAPGNKRWSFDGTPKVVSGIDAKSLDVIKGLYDGIFQTTVPVSGPKVAELAKLLENTFRLVNISLMNELATLAAPLGVNLWEAIDAAATKPFGFTRFTPGPGVGGHCLPVDPLFLSWKVEQELGTSFRFVDLADDVNRHMPDYVVQRVVDGLDKRGLPVKGSRILLLGLTYKYNATDLRNSPSTRIAELLTGLGADVRGADPNVQESDTSKLNVPWVDASLQEVAAADAVVLLMDHTHFDLTMIETNASYVLDCRNRLSGTNVETL
ncbi:nucleotide sugar dehydrogenase [Streptomyces sp. BE147]|uniref:nucleotide sugar dehydrogenase n=1 Tax=Streptomyces sp. BE147 TaxID=3002524 RepID=UPI002E76A153|nr:nucleotide sugar dehydrogenase [Streptomyces sp. BE147]MEE1737570.1 nucleotide sugar dehydrogenase [Streptomyces sp. BE147]